MLILTRKAGDSVLIGDNIKITVLSINGKQIKIGVDAPKEIDVLREELTDTEDSTWSLIDD